MGRYERKREAKSIENIFSYAAILKLYYDLNYRYSRIVKKHDFSTIKDPQKEIQMPAGPQFLIP